MDINSDMKAAYSRFLPDILTAKTTVVRHERTGKPPLLRICLNGRATPQRFTIHRTGVPSNCCTVIKLLYREMKQGHVQKQSLPAAADSLMPQFSDSSLLLAELNNFAMRGRAF